MNTQTGIGLTLMLVTLLMFDAESIRWQWRNPELLTQPLRKTAISGSKRAALANVIANELKPDMQELGIESEEQLKEAALDTRVKFIDLNGDGIPEVIAQGMSTEGCSPTGNCPFWIFQKSKRGFTALISTGGIQTFQIQRSGTNGFKDIVVETHGSATESTLRILRYGDGKYHSQGCYDANWTVLQGDTVRELKEPQVTPCQPPSPAP